MTNNLTNKLINLANTLDESGFKKGADRVDSLIKNADKGAAKITYDEEEQLIKDHTNNKSISWPELFQLFQNVSSSLIDNWVKTDDFINAIYNKAKGDTPRGYKYVRIPQEVFMENLLKKITYPGLGFTFEIHNDYGAKASYQVEPNQIIIWMQVFARSNGIDSIKYLTKVITHEVTHAIQFQIKNLKTGTYVPVGLGQRWRKPIDTAMTTDMSEVFSGEINSIIDRGAIDSYDKFVEIMLNKSTNFKSYIEESLAEDPDHYRGIWEEHRGSTFQDIHIHQQLTKLKLIIKDTANNINSYTDFCSLTLDQVKFPSELSEISSLLYILKCDEASQITFNEDIATNINTTSPDPLGSPSTVSANLRTHRLAVK